MTKYKYIYIENFLHSLEENLCEVNVSNVVFEISLRKLQIIHSNIHKNNLQIKHRFLLNRPKIQTPPPK